jgi:hypothetical protein
MKTVSKIGLAQMPTVQPAAITSSTITFDQQYFYPYIFFILPFK